MKVQTLISLAFIALSLASPLFAQDPDPKPKKESWIVVEKTKHDFDVIEAEDLKDLKKQLDENYKQAVADWTKAKAEAKKEKKEFKEPKPEKPIGKKVAGPFKSETEAREHLKKMLDKNKKKDKDDDE